MSTRAPASNAPASSTVRSPRPPGTIVSDRGTLLTPLPSSAALETPSELYKPVDCLSVPKPIAYGAPLGAQQPTTSVLASNPLHPESLSRGTKLSVIQHRPLACASAQKKAGRKPKGSLRSNKSSFISRGVVFDTFAKRLGDVRKIDDLSRCIVLTNYERSLNLLDFGAATPQLKVEPLAKTFLAKAWPLCHEVNPATVGHQQIDLAVGTSAGDLLWMELTSQRYARVNKLGNVTHAPVTAIAWFPNSESLVAAAHANGLVVVYDFHAEDSTEPPAAYQQRVAAQSQPANRAYQVLLSLGESDANNTRQTVKAVYRLSNADQHIRKLVFLSASMLLVASEDDYVKVFNLELETTTGLIPSFFGAVNALAVSPDGRFLAIAGQDDFISMFDTEQFRLVARLSGHVAWVTGIAFDPYNDDRSSYKLASVGDDGQVCLWLFVPSIVGHHPRRHSALHVVSTLRYGVEDHKLGNTQTVVYGRTPQNDVAQVFPSSQVRPALPEYGDTSLTDIHFTENLLLAASLDGRIYTWARTQLRPQS